MIDYTSFFLNSSSFVTKLECVEINHPSFKKPFRFVKNDVDGLTVLEAGKQVHYEYQPMSIQRSTVSNDLDQKLALTLADVDDQFIKAIVNARLSEHWSVRPTLKWRLYRDDDLTRPMVSLQTLEVSELSKDGSGNCTFDANAPGLNNSGTGEDYNIEKYKLLRSI